MLPRFDIVINHRRRLNFVRLKELGYASCDPFPILPHFDAIYELLGTFKASTLIETTTTNCAARALVRERRSRRENC